MFSSVVTLFFSSVSSEEIVLFSIVILLPAVKICCALKLVRASETVIAPVPPCDTGNVPLKSVNFVGLFSKSL